ncbi:MAG: helix-turn-helix transcriptional regulator [Clostridia bacterium]|nr:helix-turn-helix transcriptional regulator [Clostridia bacterium]
MEIRKFERTYENITFNYALYNCSNFEFNLTTVNCTKKEFFSTHMHPFTEIVFLKEGVLKFYYEDSIIDLMANDLIVTPPLKYHFYESQANTRHEKIVFQIKTPDFFNNCNFTELKKINVSNNMILSSVFKRFEYYIKNSEKPILNENFKTLIEGLAQELIINLTCLEEDFLLPKTENRLLSSILTHINENLNKINNLKDITQKFYISENYLHKLFKENLRITPLNYINQKKITLAKNLIEYGHSLSSIAEQCGFNSYASFYRCYKKYFGTTPSQLKNKQ